MARLEWQLLLLFLPSRARRACVRPPDPHGSFSQVFGHVCAACATGRTRARATGTSPTLSQYAFRLQ